MHRDPDESTELTVFLADVEVEVPRESMATVMATVALLRTHHPSDQAPHAVADP